MKVLASLLIFMFLLSGCAAYKELQPDPEITPFEMGYTELKDGDDNFELEKDSKYYLTIPGPPDDHFYLVLTTPVKPAISSFLTDRFEDGEGTMTRIPDEATSNATTYVYPIDRKSPTYYWLIDTVSNDLELTMTYRYVPQWRYTFENKYSEFKDILVSNTVDRGTYNSIDANFNVDRLNLEGEIGQVEGRTASIATMKGELLHLESVFPANIASSRDTAYEQYVTFKGRVEDELTFQESYATLLHVFKKERDTRGSTAAFLDAVPYFTEALGQRERFTAGARAKASQVIGGRLSEVAPFFDNLLSSKGDISKISPAPTVEAVGGLYRANDQVMPGETENILQFINRFNEEVDGLEASTKKFEDLRKEFENPAGSAGERRYGDLAAKAGEIKNSIPESQAGRSSRYTCGVMLGREVTNAINKANDLQVMFQTAGSVAGSIESGAWSPAEMQLRDIHETHGASSSPDVAAMRSTLVKGLETEIFNGVRSASERRIEDFIRTHAGAIDGVPALYADPAFLPVHQLTFSSLGGGDLQQRRKQIEGHLDQIKYIDFPENSIKRIYSEFTRNTKERGVEKARAIVEHGKFYKGTDKQVQGLITECDVQAAKWITRPKDYRKLFALPVTTNPQGMNEYMFRVRLQIPSDAQFPVFDVNIKLPQEVAEKAGQSQWYESISIDKKPLKSEGRFRITSPTADNNYETLITPVQMDKAGRNVLEVRFKYPGFRVFEVSTMAQVPIIRKN